NPAKIDGDLFFRAQPDWNLSSATFNGEVNFGYVNVGGGVDFSGVQFKSGGAPINFEGAQIKSIAVFSATVFDSGITPISFDSIDIGGRAFFIGATFESDMTFVGAHFGSLLGFLGVGCKKNISFNSVKIEGLASFGLDSATQRAACFDGAVDFTAAEFGLDAVFDQARFESIDKAVSFDRARIGGNAWFRGAYFGSGVNFRGIKITGDAFFKSEPTLTISPAAFKGTTYFTDAQIGASGEFQNVQFADVVFEGAYFGRNLLLQRTHFAGLAKFSRMHIGGALTCEGAVFD